MRKYLSIAIFLFVLVGLFGCNHSHNYSESIVNSTCTEDGYTKYICECGDSYKDKVVKATGHTLGKWEVIEEPTAEKDGLKERNCSSCDYKEEDIISINSHEHTYSEVVVEPTCTEDGYVYYECSCGDKKTEVITSSGHSYSEVVVDPTCTEDGYVYYECSCGDKKTEVITSSGHSYSEWKTIKQPSINIPGLKVKECSVCKDTVEEEIPVLPQDTEYNVYYDLDGGVLTGGYATIEELAQAFLDDFNKYGNTNATLSNFLSDSTSSVKDALSKKEMLEKWNWLFAYMYEDLSKYNTENGNMGQAYVKDALDLLIKMVEKDVAVIKDATKGPNFRTLVRSYLHGIMNKTKGDQTNNATFATFVPDFADEQVQKPLLEAQYELEAVLKHGTVLPIPEKEYYKFIGWMNDEGEIVEIVNMEGFYTALWEELNPVKDVQILNKIEEIIIYETYQLKWAIYPSALANQNVEISSSNGNIASVDKNGLITAKNDGTAVIKVKSLAESGKYDEFTLKVIKPGHFDISYETTSYVVNGNTITLNAKYISSKNEVFDVEWKSLNEDIAIVEEGGYVSGIKAGVATIRAYAVGNPDEYQDFIVTVIDQETFDALQTFLDAHESNVYLEFNLPIGAGTPVYYADIIGSVSKLLYNDELYIDTTYNKATNNKYGADLEARRMESIEFITVHYTGNMNANANGKMHASYFAQPLSSVNTSIHYSTGNDGVFKGLDEEYRAAHAGDDGSLDTVAKFEWRDTPVEVLPTDPLFAVVTITKDATFAINDRDTGIKVPEETKFGRGYVTENKWLNDMGIAVNVKDGKYQLGTAWWCYTQIGEGRICSNGGNRNSIGIESAVDKGSDLWYTWQKTAQLVADIMLRHNLDITRVKGHHFFSAKDCPQPMLENELRLWWEFIELVQAEYDKLFKCKDMVVSFMSNSEYLDDNGRVLKRGLNSEVVTYKLQIQRGSKVEEIELASIIQGIYND